MNKNIKKISVIIAGLLATLFMAFSLSGCFFYDSDDSIWRECMERFETAFSSKDRAATKALFAPNAASQIEYFDEKIEELYSYCDEEVISYRSISYGSTTDSDYGKVVKNFSREVRITTNEGEYQTYLIWRVQDDNDENNIGIWKFSFSKMEGPWSDMGLGSTFSKSEPDLLVGRVPRLYLMLNILKELQSGEPEKFKALFAPNALAQVEDIDGEIEELLEYYDGYFVALGIRNVGFELTDKRDENGKLEGYSYKYSDDIQLSEYPGGDVYGLSEKGPDTSVDYFANRTYYGICFEWTIRDDEDEGNVGLWSLYIIQKESISRKDPAYWGDGLWTRGINIGKTADQTPSDSSQLV